MNYFFMEFTFFGVSLKSFYIIRVAMETSPEKKKIQPAAITYIPTIASTSNTA